MPEETSKYNSFNPDWEKEIAAYDDACERTEAEFYAHHLLAKDIDNPDLTEEETLIMKLYLSGSSCKDIAKQISAEISAVEDVLEIARIKLSMEE